jgi:peptidoglycan/LPS O-acetylase OafA/YrhL
MNMGNYIAGIIYGIIFCEFKSELQQHKRTLMLQALWVSSFLIGFVVSILGFPFEELEIETSIWTSLFGSFMKHYHGVVFGFFMMGLIFGYGGIIQKISTFRLFTFLGRISYSFFICHVFVTKLLILSSTQLLEISNSTMVRFQQVLSRSYDRTKFVVLVGVCLWSSHIRQSPGNSVDAFD